MLSVLLHSIANNMKDIKMKNKMKLGALGIVLLSLSSAANAGGCHYELMELTDYIICQIGL